MKNKQNLFAIIFSVIFNLVIIGLYCIPFYELYNAELPSRLEENTFIEYMENKGCVVNNVLENEEIFGIDKYYVTDENSCPYLMSYIIFNDYNILNDYFDKMYSDLIYGNTNVTGNYSVTFDHPKEYYEYSTSGDYYKNIVYNDYSILAASVKKEYRSETINIFKDFNQHYEFEFKNYSFIFCSIIIMFILFFICMWGISKKIRNKGWISLIPFYNIGCLSKDILGSTWYALLIVVPIANIYFLYKFFYNMGKAFNKSESFCGMMMFIPTILWPIVAFDDSTYSKPNKINSEVKVEVPKKEKEKLTFKKFIRYIIDTIKYIFATLFIIFGLVSFFPDTEFTLYEKIYIGLFFVLYGLLLLPCITNYTKRFKIYTKFKPLIVIVIIIINFILLMFLGE